MEAQSAGQSARQERTFARFLVDLWAGLPLSGQLKSKAKGGFEGKIKRRINPLEETPTPQAPNPPLSGHSPLKAHTPSDEAPQCRLRVYLSRLHETLPRQKYS